MVGGGGDGHDGLPRVAGADLDAEGEQVFSVQGRRWGEVEQLEPGGAEALRAQERSSGVGQDGPGAACFAAKRIVGFRPRDGVLPGAIGDCGGQQDPEATGFGGDVTQSTTGESAGSSALG